MFRILWGTKPVGKEETQDLIIIIKKSDLILKIDWFIKKIKKKKKKEKKKKKNETVGPIKKKVKKT